MQKNHGAATVLSVFLLTALLLSGCGRNRSPEPMVTPTAIAALELPPADSSSAAVPTLAPTLAPPTAVPTELPTEPATEAATEVATEVATTVPVEEPTEVAAATETPAPEAAVVASASATLTATVTLTATEEASVTVALTETAVQDSTLLPGATAEMTATVEPAEAVRLIGSTPTAEFQPAVVTPEPQESMSPESPLATPTAEGEAAIEPSAAISESTALTGAVAAQEPLSAAEEITALTGITATADVTSSASLSAGVSLTTSEQLTATEPLTTAETLTETAPDGGLDWLATLGNAVFELPSPTLSSPVTLTDGLYLSGSITKSTEVSGSVAAPTFAQSVRLLPLLARGDLDGEEGDEAAVVAQLNRGVRTELYLVTFAGGADPDAAPSQQAAALLGPGLLLADLAIDEEAIVVSVEAPGAHGAACCPTHAERRTYLLRDGRLSLRETEPLTLPVTPKLSEPIAFDSLSFRRGVAEVYADLGADEVQGYWFAAEAGSPVTATVTVGDEGDAPLLVVAGSVDRLLLQSATAHSASWTGLLPNMQEVALYVVSLGESTPYTLTVQVTNPANATKQADEK